jgi:hypothetical protein
LPKSYGTIRWGTDMDPGGVDTASDLESLEQDVLHILQQTLGSNLADPNKGVGIGDNLSGNLPALQAKVALIDSQLADVSRISSSQSSLGAQNPDGSWPITVVVVVGSEVVSLEYALGPNGLSGPQ